MDILEEYILENSSVETIEKWMQKKAKKLNKKSKPTRGKNTLDSWKVKFNLIVSQTYFFIV